MPTDCFNVSACFNIAIVRVRVWDYDAHARQSKPTELDVCGSCLDRLAGDYPDNIENVRTYTNAR